MHATRRLAAVALVALLLSIFQLPGNHWDASAKETDTRTLDVGEYFTYEEEDLVALDTLEIELECDGPVDVYILTFKELRYYEDNESFDAVWEKEERSSFSEEVEIPDDGDYVIVVDNMDNSRSGDEVPVENVTYTLTYEVSEIEVSTEDLLLCCVLPIVGVVIVVIVGVWFFLRWRKKKDEERMAYAPPTGPMYGQNDEDYPPPKYR